MPETSILNLQREYFKLSNHYNLSVIHNQPSAERPTLLFIHGFGGRSNQWQEQLDYFCTNYNVIAYDQLGQGLSDKPQAPPEHNLYSLASLTQQCDEVFKHYCTTETTLIAHSYGAALACLLAIKYPKQISRIILIAPIPLKSPPFMANILQPLPTYFLNLLRPLLLKNHMNQIFSATTPQIIIDNEYKHFSEISPEILHQLINGMPAIKTIDTTKISQPTLLLYSTKDKLTRYQAIQKSYQPLAYLTWKEIPNAAHMIQLEQPNLINQIIAEFIK